jgi:hypothetical protein
MEDILKSPLARKLFKIDGIKAVCKFGNPSHFVSFTALELWSHLFDSRVVKILAMTL